MTGPEIPHFRTLKVWGSFFAGILAFFIAAEIVLRLLPISHGVLWEHWSADWPANRLVGGRSYTHSFGWDLRQPRRGNVNQQGFIAPFDYLAGARIVAVIGNSFVEAQAIAYDQTLQGRLPLEQRTGLPVYNFGVSNAGLADYLAVAGLVAQHYRPQWAVFVISLHDVRISLTNRPEKHHFTVSSDGRVTLSHGALPERGTVRRILREMALVNYLRRNLGLSMEGFFDLEQRRTPSGEGMTRQEQIVVRYFLDRVPEALSLPRDRIILLFDCDRSGMRDGISGAGGNHGSRNPNPDVAVQKYFLSAARAGGFRVVDTEQAFGRYFQSTGTTPDFLPVEGHWNAAGHGLAAELIGKVLDARSDWAVGSCLSEGLAFRAPAHPAPETGH